MLGDINALARKMSSLAQRLLSPVTFTRLEKGSQRGFITFDRLETGSHLHQIEGYSMLAKGSRPGDVLRSVPFCVGGQKWQLLLYPNGVDADHRGFVSANLRLLDCGSDARATYRMSILDCAGNPAHRCAIGPLRRLQGCCDTCEPTMKTGVYELVAVDKLLQSAPFLLKNDCLNVQCDVFVVNTYTSCNRW